MLILSLFFYVKIIFFFIKKLCAFIVYFDMKYKPTLFKLLKTCLNFSKYSLSKYNIVYLFYVI